MPTGYTADLYEGKEVGFPEFVLQCARAFGATITMRDDPWDAPIPDEFRPSDYHAVAAEAARQALAEVEKWTPSRAEQAARRDHQTALDAYESYRTDRAAMRERYEVMLARVSEWEPPTLGHRELKKFMQDQLRESIDFDTKVDRYPSPVQQSGNAFKVQQTAKYRRDVEYHEQHYAEEVERARERSEWVRQLRQSLQTVDA